MPDCNKNYLFYQYYGMACTFEVNAVKYSMPLTFTYFFISILQKKNGTKIFSFKLLANMNKKIICEVSQPFCPFHVFRFHPFPSFHVFGSRWTQSANELLYSFRFWRRKKKLLKGQIWLKGQKLKQNRAFTPLTEWIENKII